VAAAVGDNTSGVAGIAYRCKILPVKIFSGEDIVPFDILADALRYAGQKADVLSCSWGIPPSGDVEQAIKDVVQTGRGGKGSPVFVATGNQSSSSISFPASVPEAIAVGASTNRGKLSGYSNHGEGIDFVAPSSGGTRGIFTTDVSISGRGYNVGDPNNGDTEGLYTNSFGGTSSATPLAAGIAALILSVNTNLKWDQVRKYMRDTADKIDTEHGYYVNGYSVYYGFGRVNAYKALRAVRDDIGGEEHIVDKLVTSALSIPDNDLEGILSTINIDEEGTIAIVEEISINITHTRRSDLRVSLLTPGNEVISLHKGQGGGADDLVKKYNVGNTPSLQQLEGKGIRGNWSLKVVDRSPQDTGTLNSWGLKIRVSSNIVRESASPGTHIPDQDPEGIISTISFSKQGQIKDIKLSVDISHTYVGDLTVSLTSPSNTSVLVHNRTGEDEDYLRTVYNIASCPQLSNFLGQNILGEWRLAVADHMGHDVGKLNWWEIEIRI
jgi:subtilisin-like proprotein convertase family protein